jgi:hypothetical protein
MWNGIEELARIRRQELLAEAARERLARSARARPCDETRPWIDRLPTRREPLSETVR